MSTSRDALRVTLQQTRTTIARAAPKAHEAIKYGLPTFAGNGTLVHFGAFQHHIGFYAMPDGARRVHGGAVGLQERQGIGAVSARSTSAAFAHRQDRKVQGAGRRGEATGRPGFAATVIRLAALPTVQRRWCCRIKLACPARGGQPRILSLVKRRRLANRIRLHES